MSLSQKTRFHCEQNLGKLWGYLLKLNDKWIAWMSSGFGFGLTPLSEKKSPSNLHYIAWISLTSQQHSSIRYISDFPFFSMFKMRSMYHITVDIDTDARAL